MTNRDRILNKLRATGRPFADAPPRPTDYMPVARIDAEAPDALLERFQAELSALSGETFVVGSADAARAQVLELLKSHDAKHLTSWLFKHIPVPKLYTALQDAGYIIDYADTRKADSRPDDLKRLETADVGLTGADAVVAATGTLIVSTGAGKSRIPTVLPPVHIAVVRLRQFVPRLEDWLAAERESGAKALTDAANVCFISGPSRTADIEKQLVLGVHGPKQLQVVVIR